MYNLYLHYLVHPGLIGQTQCSTNNTNKTKRITVLMNSIFSILIARLHGSSKHNAIQKKAKE